MLNSLRDTICMSFIYSEDDNILVFDGGFPFEYENLYTHLKKLGTHVHTWFFSHPHIDHIGAFCELMEKYGDDITVDNLCYNFVSNELMEKYDTKDAKDSIPLIKRINDIVAKYKINVITAKKDDVYTIGRSTVTVLREPNPYITHALINNSSIVLRLDTAGKSILFLGDLSVDGGEDLLAVANHDDLKCDYVQMAHHGQGGISKEAYKILDPKYCLWCTPTWLWDNIGENGYDTNVFGTIIVRGWMSEMKIKKHYLFHDGTVEIDI